jgi:hypothetical protein
MQTQVAHAPAMSGGFPCQRADAGGEPYRHSPRRKIVTERADRRLVFEQRSWHTDAMPVGVTVTSATWPLQGRRGPSRGNGLLRARESSHASLIHRERRSRDTPGCLCIRESGPPLADLSPGPRKLSVWTPARDVFCKRFGGLRECLSGLVIALNGGNYPVLLNLSSLGMPGNWVF